MSESSAGECTPGWLDSRWEMDIDDGPSINEDKVTWKKLTQKRYLRWRYGNMKIKESNFIRQMLETFNINDEEAERMFNSSQKLSTCTKLRSFTFKFLHGVTYASKRLKQMGLIEDDTCTLCNEDQQDFIHLFFDCPEVIRFRLELSERFEIFKKIPFTPKRIYIGELCTKTEGAKAFNFINAIINNHVFYCNKIKIP